MPKNKRVALFLFLGIGFAARAGTVSELDLKGFESKSEAPMEWSKNPFVQPVGEVDVSEMKLMAVVYSEGDAAALINGETVRVGERIGFSEVTEIDPNRVILRNDNGIFYLTLEGNEEKTEN